MGRYSVNEQNAQRVASDGVAAAAARVRRDRLFLVEEEVRRAIHVVVERTQRLSNISLIEAQFEELFRRRQSSFGAARRAALRGARLRQRLGLCINQ